MLESQLDRINQISTVDAMGGALAQTLAEKIALMHVKKTFRAQMNELNREKHQLESIQTDLGIDMMTGNVVREKVQNLFHTKKDFERTVENLVNLTTPETRSFKQVIDLVKIIKQMDFFKEQIVPMVDVDAHEVARRLKYKFVPKGQCIRAALSENIGLHFIMAGKVVTSFPQQAYVQEMAKAEGKALAAMNAVTTATVD